jgi:starvation-inducible outer membrane lipoprotein
MKKVVVVLLCVLLLAACAPPTPEVIEKTSVIQPVTASSEVVRYCDEQAGVVCWVGGGGISCLPLNQTTLLECK